MISEQNAVGAHWAKRHSALRENGEKKKRERMALFCKDDPRKQDDTRPHSTRFLLAKNPQQANPERQKAAKRLGWRGWGCLLQGRRVSVYSDGNTLNAERRLIKCFKTVRVLLHEFHLNSFEELESPQGALSPAMEPGVI